ncbi:S8 family serine peptidase [Patescibacteria group bacterium]|nr:S8 family serine peptidase [Patescibacteria group bacterium]
MKVYKNAPVLLTLGVAVFFSYLSLKTLSNDMATGFSETSLRTFKELNYTNEMVLVEDLLHDSNSRLVSSLYESNVLYVPDEKVQTYKGLLATIHDDKDGDSVILLEPQKEYSNAQLEALAIQYKSLVPEFKDVEVDQEIDLSGYPVYRLSPEFEEKISDIKTEAKKPYNPVRVAVVDSGVDPEHEIFDDEHLESGWNVVDDSINMYDDVGHGTHIAGIIRMQAPDAVIIPYKIVDINGGKLSNVIIAFDKAIDTKVDVINTSFGVLSPSTALKTVTDEAAENGILVISAAGNMSSSEGFYPATYPSSIAVASVDNNGVMMTKSDFGDWVDIASYGTAIWSSLPGNKYGYKSGTSQATAYITAAIVRLIEKEGPLDKESALNELNGYGKAITAGPLAGLYIVK